MVIRFTFRNVDSSEIFDAMTSVKTNSVGPDDIPIKFLKIIYPVISRHFTFLLNSIITRSIYPKSWKLGRVVPIPKIKLPRIISDYRPISILNAVSKVLEILLRKRKSKC